MLEKLGSDGRKLVTIIDPHTKVEEGYWFHKDVKDQGLNVKLPDDRGDYQSECWPKESTWLDFLNKKTRDYVKDLYAKIPEGHPDPENYIWVNKNVMVWNDMNEPACFNQTEATISKSAIHNFVADDPKEDS